MAEFDPSEAGFGAYEPPTTTAAPPAPQQGDTMEAAGFGAYEPPTTSMMRDPKKDQELLMSAGAPQGFWTGLGKSAVSGLERGTVGLAAMPFDVGEYAARGLSWLTGTGRKPEELASSTFRKKAEEYTGPFYEAQTKPEKYVQTAAEFVPGALVSPARSVGQIGANILRYGVAPGLTSEAGGQLTEGGPLEPYARVAGGVVGGVGASALSRPSTAARAIAGQMPENVSPQTIAQADALMRDAMQRGVNLTWPEALSQVAGQPVLSRAMRVVESSPQSAPRMEEFYGQRPAQVRTAAEAELGRIAPPTTQPYNIGPEVGQTAERAINEQRQAINTASESFYQAGETRTILPQDWATIQATPGWKAARDAVRNDPQLNRYVGMLPDNSVGFVDAVKKYLEQQAENATSPVQQGRSVQRAAGLRSDADVMRQASVNASPEYAQALAIQIHQRETYLDPMLNGPLGALAKSDMSTQRAINVLFPKEPLPQSEQQIADAVSRVSQRSPLAAQQLVKAYLGQQLDAAYNAAGRGQEAAQFAGASFAARVGGSPVVDTQRLANIRAAIGALPNGAQRWQGFERFLEIAQATGTRQPKGSMTAFNEQELQRLSSTGRAADIIKTAASPEKWLTLAHDLIGRWQLGRNLDRIAEILTDPAAGRTLRQIASAPPESREGMLLAARLVAQTHATLQRTPGDQYPYYQAR